MNIKKNIKDIKEKITKLNSYTSNPFEYKEDSFAFFQQKAKTYVWVEDKEN